MSRPPATNKVPTKDMYWFAHGGLESGNEKCLNRTAPGEGEEDGVDSGARSLQERRGHSDEQKSPLYLNSAVDSGHSSGPSSLETKEEKNRYAEKRIAVEERRKQLLEAEQEKHDAVLRKHMERDAALEARRNAQRSNISFAFGSSVPRNVESLQTGDSDKLNRHSNASGLLPKEENHDTLHLRRSVSPFNYSGYTVEVDGTSPRPNSSQSNLYSERTTFSPPCWLVGSGALIGGGGGADDIMSKSMTAAVPAPRGRRKNDLMPTVPYERTAAPKSATSSSTRKRSVSMTRLDQLALPRRHYVEANKANSTASSGASSMLKDTIKSPTRPLSSASEQSGNSGRVGGSATRRLRSSPRKPRPVSIAGTVPDSKPHADRVSPIKKTFVASKKPLTEVKKASPATSTHSSAKSNEKSKPLEKAKPTPRPSSTPKPAKPLTAKQPPQPKTSPKTPTAKKAVTNKKKADIMVSAQPLAEVTPNQSLESTKSSASPSVSPPPDNAAIEANNAKRIISEEEAKAALAEKRRLAREQAEKEAELERQKQEELRQQEEERLRLEEEEQKRMEEEQLRLLEEHRKLEEEKLRKAIEENERKEEEERAKREEDQRLKAEQEKKAQEEAEKQRIELEEKLKKEEEERAERKKRLEKIMSRTRGKSSGTSPSGSVSGSEQLDSSENQQENLSSGGNSLDSNVGEIASGPASLEGHAEKLEPLSDGTSMEANPTYEVGSDNESLNDMVMPKSETASQDNSLVIIPESSDLKASAADLAVKSQLDDTVVLKTEVSEVQAEEDKTICAEEVKEEIKASAPEEVEICPEEYQSEQIEEEKTLSSVSNQEEKIDLEKTVEVEQYHNEASDVISQDVVIPVETEKNYEKFDVEIPSEKHIEEIIQPPSESAPLLQTTPVFSSEESETAIINQTEVILSFEESIKEREDMSDNVADNTSTLLPDVSPPSEQIGNEEAEIEHHSHFSTSSDIKLPDPIYETSDDGSISSERHHQDFRNFGLQDEEHHQESHPIADEVFNEKEVLYSEETNFNPFEKQNSSHLMAAYESQFDMGGMQDSIYAYETSDAPLHGVIEQPRELGEENVYPTRSSTSSVHDVSEDLVNVTAGVDTYTDENKENIGNETSFSQTNPFAAVGNNVCDAYADKENIEFNSPGGAVSDDVSVYKSDMLPEQLNLEINQVESTDSSNNTFVMQESTILEQNFENPPVLNKSPTLLSESLDLNNVTIIKAEGGNDCIGIISSVENDHVSNELVQQSIQHEQLKSNYEYSSITDSEESSLDSNLSQVMTVEVSENNFVGLNIENDSTVVLNNVQAENPFNEPAVNGSSDSKSNGDHYSETQVLSNGHRIESSDPKLEQIGGFVQLDGKHISSVDHSKTNIFDNVDAVDFGKMSPDPFLAKGNSNQISGNPFLLQDDQKQVLMTPDFFN